MDFASRIKEERTKLGYSQKEVAEALFVTRQTISKWETGKSYPDLELLASLSDLYEISVDSLLKEDEKLMEFMKDNPRATKKQKLSTLLISAITAAFWTGMLLYAYSLHNLPLVGQILLILFAIPSTIYFLIVVGQIIGVLRRKESTIARKKRLASPAHELENKRIIFDLISTGGFIVAFIGISVQNFILMFIGLTTEILAGSISMYQTKKIRDKLNSKPHFKKFRDWRLGAKVLYVLTLLFFLSIGLYIIIWVI